MATSPSGKRNNTVRSRPCRHRSLALPQPAIKRALHRAVNATAKWVTSVGRLPFVPRVIDRVERPSRPRGEASDWCAARDALGDKQNDAAYLPKPVKVARGVANLCLRLVRQQQSCYQYGYGEPAIAEE